MQGVCKVYARYMHQHRDDYGPSRDIKLGIGSEGTCYCYIGVPKRSRRYVAHMTLQVCVYFLWGRAGCLKSPTYVGHRQYFLSETWHARYQ